MSRILRKAKHVDCLNVVGGNNIWGFGSATTRTPQVHVWPPSLSSKQGEAQKRIPWQFSPDTDFYFFERTRAQNTSTEKLLINRDTVISSACWAHITVSIYPPLAGRYQRRQRHSMVIWTWLCEIPDRSPGWLRLLQGPESICTIRNLVTISGIHL